MSPATLIPHTTNAALVATKVAREPVRSLRPEDLPLDEDARGVWCQVTEDEGILQHAVLVPVRSILHRLRRATDRSCPLVLAARLIVRLAAAGVPEWRLRLVPLFLERVIESCFAGSSHRSIDDIDRDEQHIESCETELTLERRIAESHASEVSEEALLNEAAINEAEAAIQLERARALRRRARTLSFRLPARVGVAAS